MPASLAGTFCFCSRCAGDFGPTSGGCPICQMWVEQLLRIYFVGQELVADSGTDGEPPPGPPPVAAPRAEPTPQVPRTTVATIPADSPDELAIFAEGHAQAATTWMAEHGNSSSLRFYAVWNCRNTPGIIGVHAGVGCTASERILRDSRGGALRWRRCPTLTEALRLFSEERLAAGLWPRASFHGHVGARTL